MCTSYAEKLRDKSDIDPLCAVVVGGEGEINLSEI